MKKLFGAGLAGALSLFALLFIMGAGPGTITFPNVLRYGVTFGAGGEYHSTTALVDVNDPSKGVALGQQTSANSLPVTIASDQAALPVSFNTGSLALDTSVTGLHVAQGSTTSGQTGELIQGAVTTSTPSYTNGLTSPLSLTTGGGLRVDGSGVTQPVSGTVTANIGTSGSLALDASVTGLQVAQGSTTSGQKGNMIQGAVSTAAPSYTNAQTSPFSLTTGGALRVDASAATINVGTHTATNYLLSTGTNGFTTTPFSVLTTELNSLASAGVATSSVNGTSGKFSQSNSGSSLYGRCWVTLGGALGGAASAGANFSIWFLTSTDGGTTFESQTVSPPPRSADIVIPVGANAYGANAVLMTPPRVNLWSETVKIVFQNNTGQAMAASGNIMTCGPQATNN